jgi:hypothetical protein
LERSPRSSSALEPVRCVACAPKPPRARPNGILRVAPPLRASGSNDVANAFGALLCAALRRCLRRVCACSARHGRTWWLRGANAPSACGRILLPLHAAAARPLLALLSHVTRAPRASAAQARPSARAR